jgi:DNA polymerase-3 subunit gamma/tau
MAIEQAVPGALPETDPDATDARALAARMAADETQLLYSLALHGRQELNLTPDTYAGLTMILLRLFAFTPEESPPARPVGPASNREPAAGSPAAGVVASRPLRKAALAEPPAWLDEAPIEFEMAAPASPSRPEGAAVRARAGESAAPWQATPLGERWAGIVAMLEQRQLITALVRELALQAELVAQGGDGAAPLWCLRVERDSLRTTALRDKLRAAVVEGLGMAGLQLELQAGAAQDTPARRAAAEKQRRQQEAEQIIHDDPLVQEMLAQFKTARIVPGSIKPH